MKDSCVCFCFEIRGDEFLRMEDDGDGIGISFDLVLFPGGIMVIGGLIRRAMIAFLLSI